MESKYFVRKNSRLAHFDYTMEGFYFITICTKDKIHYFGEILNEEKMQFSEIGKTAYKNIEKLKDTYKTIKIDKFVIMPNHIHLILIIDKETSLSVSNIIKKYKEWVTKQIGESIWQKSYYDHIIRNEKDYLRIWKYMDENILKWSLDKYYSE
ncbi:MAG: transposase [Clostridia bacterium]|nr:transposase [Clostridia bacterium]